jgi:hypothetical protein
MLLPIFGSSATGMTTVSFATRLVADPVESLTTTK